MVDNRDENDSISRSTAHTQLINDLKARDNGDYDLARFHHMQKLQRCYTQCIKDVNDASAVDCVGAPLGCDMLIKSGGLVLIP